MWLVYCIQSGRRTYVGATLNFPRRIRQHNGEITGGARYTRGHEWKPIFRVLGFPNQRAALQFEWALQKQRGWGTNAIEKRFTALDALMRKERVTSNAEPLRNWNLVVIDDT